MRCSTCDRELTDADPEPNIYFEPLLSGHCRFCHQAADYVSFHDARSGQWKFQPWQLKLLSDWLRSKANA